MRKRVLIAGLGDTGILAAIALSKDFDVIGVTPKPGMISGQFVGARLAAPEQWKKTAFMDFRQYKGLDNVRVIQGLVKSIDMDRSTATLQTVQHETLHEPYDALLIASGVSNGFWRNNDMDGLSVAEAKIDAASKKVATADILAVVGGGATGVSIASNVAEQYPDKQIHLFYSRDALLPAYHQRVQSKIRAHLLKQHIRLHPHHRAKISTEFSYDQLTSDPIHWETGQPPFKADLVVWAVGRVSPNNAFIPTQMLDEQGFVKVDSTLRVIGLRNVFAVGDIAASDPNRSSARNFGYDIVAHNIRTFLMGGSEAKMKIYKASPHRWGEILGSQTSGLQLFTPKGRTITIPKWLVDRLLTPVVEHQFIYKGVRTKDEVQALKMQPSSELNEPT
ncbi:MAG: FAD-dependent oxidoreductase [Cyanobacteria bacterium P01_H01_bin.153]